MSDFDDEWIKRGLTLADALWNVAIKHPLFSVYNSLKNPPPKGWNKNELSEFRSKIEHWVTAKYGKPEKGSWEDILDEQSQKIDALMGDSPNNKHKKKWSYYSQNGDWVSGSGIIYFKPNKKEIGHRSGDIYGTFVGEFIAQLTDGSLVGYGRRNSSLNSFMCIPAAAYNNFNFDFENSSAEEKREESSDYLYDIRVRTIEQVAEMENAARGERDVKPAQKTAADNQSGVVDTFAPPPIPAGPKFTGKPVLKAIKKMAREHPERFEWGMDKANYTENFSKEVAAATTGIGAQRCRTVIREKETELRKIIKEAKSAR